MLLLVEFVHTSKQHLFYFFNLSKEIHWERKRTVCEKENQGHFLKLATDSVLPQASTTAWHSSGD